MDSIARLIEGRLGEIDRARVLAHLRTCKQCHEVYQDSAVEFGLHESGALTSKETPDDLVAAGMLVPDAKCVRRRAGGIGPARYNRTWSNWKLRAVAVAAVVAVVVWGGWISLRVFDRTSPVPLGIEILGAIEAAVETYSGANGFVLPGGEDFVSDSVPVYRAIPGSQFTKSDEPLDSAIDSLHDMYEAGGESPDVAYWLVAGYLATHRLGSARVYIADARGLFPDAPRLMVLDAIVAYMDGAVDRSEDLLRSAQDARPDDPAILLNLAVVLNEQHKTTEARELLDNVRERHRNTPIGERAEAMLSELQ